jgi:hypothetical protein
VSGSNKAAQGRSGAATRSHAPAARTGAVKKPAGKASVKKAASQLIPLEHDGKSDGDFSDFNVAA